MDEITFAGSAHVKTMCSLFLVLKVWQILLGLNLNKDSSAELSKHLAYSAMHIQYQPGLPLLPQTLLNQKQCDIILFNFPPPVKRTTKISSPSFKCNVSQFEPNLNPARSKWAETTAILTTSRKIFLDLVAPLLHSSSSNGPSSALEQGSGLGRLMNTTGVFMKTGMEKFKLTHLERSYRDRIVAHSHSNNTETREKEEAVERMIRQTCFVRFISSRRLSSLSHFLFLFLVLFITSSWFLTLLLSDAVSSSAVTFSSFILLCFLFFQPAANLRQLL